MGSDGGGLPDALARYADPAVGGGSGDRENVEARISAIKASYESLEQNFIPLVDDNNIYIGIIKRREIIKYLSKNVDKLALFNDE